MKNRFSWHSPLTPKEVDEAWDAGILTLDANVLLDLYRYHEGTRDSLISSIESLSALSG